MWTAKDLIVQNTNANISSHLKWLQFFTLVKMSLNICHSEFYVPNQYFHYTRENFSCENSVKIFSLSEEVQYITFWASK